MKRANQEIESKNLVTIYNDFPMIQWKAIQSFRSSKSSTSQFSVCMSRLQRWQETSISLWASGNSKWDRKTAPSRTKISTKRTWTTSSCNWLTSMLPANHSLIRLTPNLKVWQSSNPNWKTSKTVVKSLNSQTNQRRRRNRNKRRRRTRMTTTFSTTTLQKTSKYWKHYCHDQLKPWEDYQSLHHQILSTFRILYLMKLRNRWYGIGQICKLSRKQLNYQTSRSKK